MLVVDEDGDVAKSFTAFYENFRDFGDEMAAKELFEAGWNRGRMWERAHHAAMAREMSGLHGELGHPTGHTH